MKKFFLLTLFFLFLSFPLAGKAVLMMSEQAADAAASAATTTPAAGKDFAFVANEQTFSVPAAVANSWKGADQMAKHNQFLRLEYSVKDYLVATAKTPAPKDVTRYRFRLDKIYDYAKGLAQKIDVPSQEPALKLENGRVVEFTPPQIGQKVDLRQTTLDALAALERGRTTSVINIQESRPQTSLMQLNDLGINELLAHGESNFAGSPNNRRHNIATGVEKMKGVVVQRGEEFSFNHYLGEVTKQAGFLPELVIKKSGTVPELGGGLCQVSSTAFRAAMNAGLPITQRKNHAYAVQYYAPQGTDATIYPGVVDLKFVNDTPGAILVWPYLKDKNTLIFDFYGTKDDRKVVLEKPLQWDRKTDGSMKASWTREVFKNGTSTKDTFKSVYASPALFHKEEKFVAGATSTPTAQTSTQ